MRRYVQKNWYWIVVGGFLTNKAVEYAFLQRGYIAVGGEWLILPTLLLIVQLVRNVTIDVKEAIEMERWYERTTVEDSRRIQSIRSIDKRRRS